MWLPQLSSLCVPIIASKSERLWQHKRDGRCQRVQSTHTHTHTHTHTERDHYIPEVGETPVLGLDDELTSRELELAAEVRLDNVSLVLVLGAARDQNLSDLHTRGRAVRLAVSVGEQSRVR